SSKPKGLRDGGLGGRPTGSPTWTAVAGCATGAAIAGFAKTGFPIGAGPAFTAMAGCATGTFDDAEDEVFALAWKILWQCLQRIDRASHSSGMRSTFWQCGHLA